VADRSNNRIQIFDKDMTYLDSWKRFGRPSGITIVKDDTFVVADPESGVRPAGPTGSPEGVGTQFRNVGWKQGIRIGFAGPTGGCQTSRSGGCVQKNGLGNKQ
jgi:hypothetical protein